MRITVLAGGPDSERDVSLASGRAVAAALKKAGHAVRFADVSPGDLSALEWPCDAVFPALHGAWGEGGGLQVELERRGLPFVGSVSTAARLGMDKAAAKEVWADAGLSTPAWRVIDRPGLATVEGPCVVKSLTGGSSLDCFLRPCPPEGTADVAGPVAYLVAKHGRCLVEELIVGVELTVGVLGDTALPPIWVDSARTAAGWFDYQAKYSTDDAAAAHRFDLPPHVDAAELQRLAVAAHHTLGCRDLSRVDFMVDAAGRPFLLEINTMPGFTGRSLLPDAARFAGIDFSDLCDRLARAAANRATPSVAA